MIKSVLFDFFGVLHPDTFWGLADIFVPERDSARKRALGDLLIRVDLGQISRDDFWNEAAHEFGISIEKLMSEKDKLGHVDQSLMQTVKSLKDRGLKTGIISNVGPGFIEKAFDKDILNSHFDVLVLSGEEGVMKPDKKIYEIAADRLGLKPEQCLFFDDVERNVEGARNAGMQAELYDGIESCKVVLKAAGL